MTQVRSQYPLSRRRFCSLAGMSALAFALCGSGCATSGGKPSSTVTPAASSSAASAISASSAGADAGWQERTLFAFDTVVTLKCACAAEVMNRAADRCAYFEKRFSRTLEGSDVWNVNHAGGTPVAVAPETADLVEKALTYCERSEGMFDITIGAVSSLWDFKEGVKPSDDAIQEAVRHVDYRGVHVQGSSVTLDDPQAALDLGGVAKGYVADDLARLFREGGCESGVINLGGNAYVIGSKPDGSSWNVGVQDPNAPTNQAIIAKVACTDASVVTSGLYEREFTQDGVRYYHILDPKTGYPVQTDLVSSSVLTESSLDGDAFATWMFLLGSEAALSLAESIPGLEALFVTESGAMSMTQGAHFEVL